MINLTKGQTINLSKDTSAGLTKIALGTGWGRKEKKSGGFLGFGGGTSSQSVDLDASCVMLDENNNEVELISFSKLRSRCGSIKHNGDDLTGGGRATDPNEVIDVDLTKVPANVKTLVFAVQNFGGGTLKGIPNAFSVLNNKQNGEEIARFNLEELGQNDQGIILSKIYRHNGDWKFKAIGECCKGRTVKDLIPTIKRVV